MPWCRHDTIAGVQAPDHTPCRPVRSARLVTRLYGVRAAVVLAMVMAATGGVSQAQVDPTVPPTTAPPTTAPPTTLPPTTLPPTTLPPEPTTLPPTTLPPEPTTLPPTTLPPTTFVPQPTVAPAPVPAPTVPPPTEPPTTDAPTPVTPTTDRGQPTLTTPGVDMGGETPGVDQPVVVSSGGVWDGSNLVYVAAGGLVTLAGLAGYLTWLYWRHTKPSTRPTVRGHRGSPGFDVAPPGTPAPGPVVHEQTSGDSPSGADDPVGSSLPHLTMVGPQPLTTGHMSRDPQGLPPQVEPSPGLPSQGADAGFSGAQAPQVPTAEQLSVAEPAVFPTPRFGDLIAGDSDDELSR